MKKIFLGLAFVGLISSSAFGTEYGSSASDWHVFTAEKGEITNSSGGYHYFSGNGTRTGFYTTLSPVVKDGNIVNWSMYGVSNYFKIYIQLMTKEGIRYLTYYPLNQDIGKDGRFLQFGLGKNVRDSRYHKFSRDIKADLEKFDKGNELIDIRAFFVRGSNWLGHVEVVAGDPIKYRDMAKLETLLFKEGDASSLKKTFSVNEPLVAMEIFNGLDMSSMMFYTLSKDKKSIETMNLEELPLNICADGVTFTENNTRMVIHSPQNGKNTSLEDIYNISDLHNVSKISHTSRDDIECL